MKRLIVAAVATLAAVAVLGSVAYAGQTSTGNGAPSGAHFNLEIIGVPQDKVNMVKDSGKVMFVPLEGKTTILLKQGDDFAVIDGNATVDKEATFQLPPADPLNTGTTSYSVFARALGKQGSANMKSCFYDKQTASTWCATADYQVNLVRTKGKVGQFQNVSAELLYIYANIDGDTALERTPIFSDPLDSYWWEYDNSGLRHAQLRFYPGVCTMVPDPETGGTSQIIECPAS